MKIHLQKIFLSLVIIRKIIMAKDVEFGQKFKNKKFSEADTKDAYRLKKFMELEKLWSGKL